MKIKVPAVTWALGDREQAAGSEVVTRPIYYKSKRVGEIDADYSEPLMKLLLKAK